ncbi:LamG-like jellyroll fold domain-containing protein [Rubripirellula reticaptiva]|uniref:FecR protein n=1 Tax=Rubripirellula reticaptiva TaxID=2528013 RepID=A0A5C6FC02_9BACT|nr:LamG-like jellyroll fold domain-containing protein [Rubripirellula reticaptiva]TWU58130.1 FecR protein [Rubripirellula reticaptiva]
MTDSNLAESLKELEKLLIEAEDGQIDEVGYERIRELMKSSPIVRDHFVKWRMMSAAMHLEGSSGAGFGSGFSTSAPAVDHSFSVSDRSDRRKLDVTGKWRMLLAIAATGLIMLMAGQWLARWSDVARVQPPVMGDDPGADVEATSEGIALVTRLVAAKWNQSTDKFAVGDALSPGRLRIDSGFAQIEFFCGATVVLEGPAELEMQSSTMARFRSGRLRAQVPPAARGFQILVDDLKVVDLGTEFGISLSPDSADVQVFDGEVELHSPSEDKMRLLAGERMTRSIDGVVDRSPSTPEQFVDIERLDAQAEGQAEFRRNRWQKFSESLRRDDRVIAYYAMDDDQVWNRKLQSSVLPANPDLDGAIVGAARVDGRWPGKSAIEFKRPGDRVRVDIPGEFGSLTMAVWVKIDSLDRSYNSLFLTDNYERGRPHWQILDTGQLFFSVRVSDDRVKTEHREVTSPPFWKPSMSGQWLHLATTHDVKARTTTHYLNGELLSREVVSENQVVTPTRIGKASIGNWSSPTKPDAKFAIRNLNGSIDEFILCADALSDDEIRQIYENGKP